MRTPEDMADEIYFLRTRVARLERIERLLKVCLPSLRWYKGLHMLSRRSANHTFHRGHLATLIHALSSHFEQEAEHEHRQKQSV